MSLIALLGAAAVMSALPLLWWAVSGNRTSAAAARNLTAGHAPITDMHRAALRHSGHDRAVAPAIERLARTARRLTPSGRLESLERRVLRAGVPDAWPMQRVLAMKLILGATSALLGLLMVVSSPALWRILVAAAITVFGWFLPDILLYNTAEHRRIELRRALPDTLDQMTISVEAGLAFEAAMTRAGRSGDGPLNRELQRTMQDVQVGMSRAEALKGLADRTDVDEIEHFVVAVVQAESHGVPISRVLRVQSSEQRLKRRQRAEENAMKLPVKILFPLVLCILPTIFIVLLGPAVIRMVEVFG